MNIKQTIYTKAIQAGMLEENLPTPLMNQHARQVALLAVFAQSGIDSADYPDWLAVYQRTQNEYAQMENQKAVSETLANPSVK